MVEHTERRVGSSQRKTVPTTKHNTGSDSGGMNTTAKLEGDTWELNGSKNFITHAISGDVAVVSDRTG